MVEVGSSAARVRARASEQASAKRWSLQSQMVIAQLQMLVEGVSPQRSSMMMMESWVAKVSEATVFRGSPRVTEVMPSASAVMMEQGLAAMITTATAIAEREMNANAKEPVCAMAGDANAEVHAKATVHVVAEVGEASANVPAQVREATMAMVRVAAREITTMTMM